MGIRQAAAAASEAVADVRDNLSGQARMIAGLLGALVVLAAGILITLLARR